MQRCIQFSFHAGLSFWALGEVGVHAIAAEYVHILIRHPYPVQTV